jgi:hypothetical protein
LHQRAATAGSSANSDGAAMPASDPKRALGAHVHARAWNILGDIRARNRFGQFWKSSWHFGTVEAVAKSNKTIREHVSVDAAWEIGDATNAKS